MRSPPCRKAESKCLFFSIHHFAKNENSKIRAVFRFAAARGKRKAGGRAAGVGAAGKTRGGGKSAAFKKTESRAGAADRLRLPARLI
jgi:hypothetical protein